MSASVEVKVGQVWADNDPRAKGRTLRVDGLGVRLVNGRGHMPYREGVAACTVLTDRDPVLGHPVSRSSVGRKVLVQVSRFRPTRTGYRLLEDA